MPALFHRKGEGLVKVILPRIPKIGAAARPTSHQVKFLFCITDIILKVLEKVGRLNYGQHHKSNDKLIDLENHYHLNLLYLH